MTEPVDLAPCPGCGGDVQFVSSASDLGRYAVQCRCGWSAPWVSTEAEARAQWNRRAPGLRWRSEPPDVAGWWLIRYGHGRVSVARYEDAIADLARWRERSADLWLGPIPEPEEGA